MARSNCATVDGLCNSVLSRMMQDQMRSSQVSVYVLVKMKSCNFIISFSSSCYVSCLLRVSEIYEEFCPSVVARFLCWKTLNCRTSFYSVVYVNNWTPSPHSQKVCHPSRIWTSVILGGWNPILLETRESPFHIKIWLRKITWFSGQLDW